MTNDTPTTSLSDDNVIDFDALLAKREEVIGSRDKFPFLFAGDKWWIFDPELVDDAWRDRLQEITNKPDDWDDTVDGWWSVDALEWIEHWFGPDQLDEATDFVEAGGHMGVINRVLEVYQDRKRRQRGTDPTRRPSRATRRQSRRR